MDISASIHVHPNLTAQVDLADLEDIDQYRWYAKTNSNGKAYVQTFLWDKESKKSHPVQLARLIAKPGTGQLVTFRNENPLDCRKGNLVLVDRAFISRHRRKLQKAASRYKGVRRITAKWAARRWSANLRIGNHYLHLGRFATEVEAARAYDAAATRYFGIAARLNLPKQSREPAPTTYREITCVWCKRKVLTNQPRQKYCEKDGTCEHKHRYFLRKQGNHIGVKATPLADAPMTLQLGRGTGK